MKIKQITIDLTASENEFWKQVNNARKKIKRASMPWWKRLFF